MAFCGSYLWEFDVAYGIITPCWRSLFCRLQGGCFKVVTCPGLTRTLSSSNIIIIIRLYLVNSLFCLNRDSNGSSWWWWCTFDILELMKKKITFSLDGTNRKMVPLPLPISWKKSWFFSRVNSLMDVASKNLISFVFRLICTTFKEDEIFCFHYEETHISWFVVYSINLHVDLHQNCIFASYCNVV